MKKTLLTVFLCAVALPAFSQTFTTRYGQRGQRPAPAPTIQPRDEGSIQRAVRNGNPLQLINPLAPKEYGSGEDVVVYEYGTDPSQKWRDPRERPVAVRLFSFLFW